MVFSKGLFCIRLHCSIIPSSFTQCQNWNDWQIWHKLTVLAGRESVNKQYFFVAQADVLEAIFNQAQICRVFIAVFAYKDTKKHHFKNTHLLAELVHIFLTTRLLYVSTFSLGGSTELLDPQINAFSQSRLYQLLMNFVSYTRRIIVSHSH